MSVDLPAGTRTDAAERARRRAALGVARGGSVNLAGTVFSQAVRLAITYVLARFLGKADSGVYFQAFAFLALTGVLSSGGFTQSLTRFVAVHLADEDRAALRGSLRLGLSIALVASAALGIGLLAASGWLAVHAFHDQRLTLPLRLVALALPSTVYTDCALAATQGFKTMRAYARVNLFFEPAAQIVLTIVVIVLGFGVTGAVVALLVTNVTASVLASLELRRLTGRQTERPRYETRDLLRFSVVSWTSQLAASGLLWADTILLGLFRGAGDVGLYQVATRLTMFITICIAPVGAAFAPRIADLYRRGMHETLEATYALVTSWVFRLAVPIVVLLLVFPRELLSLFGPGFERGVAVTVMLTLGQVVNAVTGPCGLMLVMSGRPGIQLISNASTLALNVGLNLYLIPRFGVVGAAAAWALSIGLINIERVVAVWVTMHMLPLHRGLAKGSLAAVAALAAGVATRHAIAGAGGLLVGAAAIAVAYVAALTLIGIDADDRLAVTTIRGSVTGRLRPRSVGRAA